MQSTYLFTIYEMYSRPLVVTWNESGSMESVTSLYYLKHSFIKLLFLTATIVSAGYGEIKDGIYALQKMISNTRSGK